MLSILFFKDIVMLQKAVYGRKPGIPDNAA